MTSILALSDALLRSSGADLTEGTVAVRPAAGPADVLLAVLPGQAVGVVEADLDADPGGETVSGLGDAPLPEGAVGVCLTGLETDVPDTGVTGVTAGPVPRPAPHRGPHTPVLGVRGPVAGDPREARGTAAGWLVVD